MQGLIFIPDISGFTKFVKSIPIDLGVAITRDLLNEIIDNNPLDIQLSEIEGDAILFYKLGKPIDLKNLLAAFSAMSDAFERKFSSLKKVHHIEADLSLKLIVHYGNIIVYNIRGFKKVYGEPVIESHRLLKNGNASTHYILITDDYMMALQKNKSNPAVNDEIYTSYSSQLCSDSKTIPYSFFSTIKKTTYIADHKAKKEVRAA